MLLYVPGSINSHYFHIIGDGHQPKSVGVYIPIIRMICSSCFFSIEYISGQISSRPKTRRVSWPPNGGGGEK